MTNRSDRLDELLEKIDALVPPIPGNLPEDLFRFVSRRTPLVNVDLLLQRESPTGVRETLLTWRDDEFYLGWHVPGGVIRFKEAFTERIAAVAWTELRAIVECPPEPVAIFNLINTERATRGHFVSLLFPCTLLGGPADNLRCVDIQRPLHGQWAWHRGCPVDLLTPQRVYRRYLEGP